MPMYYLIRNVPPYLKCTQNMCMTLIVNASNTVEYNYVLRSNDDVTNRTYICIPPYSI